MPVIFITDETHRVHGYHAANPMKPVTCGAVGGSSRRRVVLVNASHNSAGAGKPCPSLSHTKKCSLIGMSDSSGNPWAWKPCPADCLLTEWQNCQICSVSCGEGTHLCNRDVINGPIFGGKPCPDILEAARPCKAADPCPTLSPTAAPSDLPTAAPTVSPTSTPTSEPTTAPSKVPVKAPWCRILEYDEWGQCSTSCGGGGVQVRAPHLFGPPIGSSSGNGLAAIYKLHSLHTYTSTYATAFEDPLGLKSSENGADFGCRSNRTSQTRRCLQTSPCPVDCKTVVLIPAPTPASTTQNLSLPDSKLKELVKEPISNPEDAFCGPCSKACGAGFRVCFLQRIVRVPQYGGKSCPSQDKLMDQRACNMRDCPKCPGTSYFPSDKSHALKVAMKAVGPIYFKLKWTPCISSHTCGQATGIQHKKVPIHQAFFNLWGVECPDDIRFLGLETDGIFNPVIATRQCTAQTLGKDGRNVPPKPCPQDCEVSSWSHSDCVLVSCEPLRGEHRQQRTITKKSLHGGIPCPAIKRTTKNATTGDPEPCSRHELRDQVMVHGCETPAPTPAPRPCSTDARKCTSCAACCSWFFSSSESLCTRCMSSRCTTAAPTQMPTKSNSTGSAALDYEFSHLTVSAPRVIRRHHVAQNSALQELELKELVKEPAEDGP
jgi:hypothetical protein